MVELVKFISVVCPQQKINRATAIPWYEIIGHLDFDAARNAVIAVKHSQAFVDPSDIVREAKRAESSKPYERTAAEAMAASSLRELAAAPAVPPTDEYLAAKRDMDEKLRLRAEQVRAVDREAERCADAWLRWKLDGTLPPDLPPLGSEPPPRYVELPDDPPGLRAWLRRQAAKLTRDGQRERVPADRAEAPR